MRLMSEILAFLLVFHLAVTCSAVNKDGKQHPHRHKHDRDVKPGTEDLFDADRPSSDSSLTNRQQLGRNHHEKTSPSLLHESADVQTEARTSALKRKSPRRNSKQRNWRNQQNWVGDEFVTRNNSDLRGTPHDFLVSLSNSSGEIRKDEILKSSRDALIVTRKQYLRSDWCKTQPLIQRVSEDGCLSTTVLNQFCYGQCNSFFIPRNLKVQNTASKHAFKSCAFCKPKKTTWVTVTLKCPSSIPAIRRRRVQVIKQCRCITEVLS